MVATEMRFHRDLEHSFNNLIIIKSISPQENKCFFQPFFQLSRTLQAGSLADLTLMCHLLCLVVIVNSYINGVLSPSLKGF